MDPGDIIIAIILLTAISVPIVIFSVYLIKLSKKTQNELVNIGKFNKVLTAEDASLKNDISKAELEINNNIKNENDQTLKKLNTVSKRVDNNFKEFQDVIGPKKVLQESSWAITRFIPV